MGWRQARVIGDESVVSFAWLPGVCSKGQWLLPILSTCTPPDDIAGWDTRAHWEAYHRYFREGSEIK